MTYSGADLEFDQGVLPPMQEGLGNVFTLLEMV